MQIKIPQGPFCQSCAMPMEKDEHFGTNVDGSKNEDYCCHCFQQGKFTDPEITLEQMVEKVSGIMQEMKLPVFIVAQAKNFIPKLKRWKK